MTCYYIENASKDSRTYDAYVPVEQMGEVLTSAMLQTAIEKFGKGEFTRKQFDELRETFRTKKTEKHFNHFRYVWFGDDERIRWRDMDFDETVAPMGFDALKERGVFKVERFEEFDIETEDGTVTGKRNFYTFSMRKAYKVIDEMEEKFERKTIASQRTVKNKVDDLKFRLKCLKEELEDYETILEAENEGRVELITDSYPDGCMLLNDCEREFEKYTNMVMERVEQEA